MATAGPRYPGSAISLSNAGSSENTDAWVSPANVGADDGTEATITAASYDSPDISQLLVAYAFGFTIPTEATIGGITVEIDRRNSAGAASDNRVQLAKGITFASLAGSSLADAATDWPTTTAAVSYGGTANLWGTTWTPAEVNAGTFAVFLSVQADAANTDIQVDYIRATVTYTVPSVAGTATITAEQATATATAQEAYRASGAATSEQATASATGAQAFRASGAIASEQAGVTASGSVTSLGPEPVTGTGAVTADQATLAATGREAFRATAGVIAEQATGTGTAKAAYRASGAVAAPEATATGDATAIVNVTGTASVTAQQARVSASGTGGESIADAFIAHIGRSLRAKWAHETVAAKPLKPKRKKRKRTDDDESFLLSLLI